MWSLSKGPMTFLVNLGNSNSLPKQGLAPMGVRQSTALPSTAGESTSQSGVSSFINKLLGVAGKCFGHEKNSRTWQISEPTVMESKLKNWNPEWGKKQLLESLKKDSTLAEYCLKAENRDQLVVTYLMHLGQRAFEHHFDKYFDQKVTRPPEISNEQWKNKRAEIRRGLGEQAWDALGTLLAEHPLAAVLKNQNVDTFMDLATHSLHTLATTLSGKLYDNSAEGVWPGGEDAAVLEQLIVSVCNAYCQEIWREMKPVNYPDVYSHITANLEKGELDELHGDVVRL